MKTADGRWHGAAWQPWAGLFLGLLLALSAAPAWAVLGQQVQSVTVDRARLGGRLRQVQARGYTVQVIERGQENAPHLTIREYVSPQGVVFGVSWHGPHIPDLQALLGSYYARFEKAAAAQRRGRGPLFVRTGDLVVENAGHMRAFHGRAFVTTLIPHNLSAAVVQ
ncbi:MAG: DUF2844 domain-containing protein [Terriglobales bacterium]